MKEYQTYAIMMSSWRNPSLMWIKDGLLRYLGYYQNIGEYDPEYHTIVHGYGYVKDDDEDMDRVDIEHVNNFPPEEGISDSCGWLLPDGSFYACTYSEHDSSARHIYKYVYQKHPDCNGRSFIAYVESLGWMRVTKTCVMYQDGYKATRKQIDALFELIMLSGDKQFKQSIKWDLEDFTE